MTSQDEPAEGMACVGLWDGRSWNKQGRKGVGVAQSTRVCGAGLVVPGDGGQGGRCLWALRSFADRAVVSLHPALGLHSCPVPSPVPRVSSQGPLEIEIDSDPKDTGDCQPVLPNGTPPWGDPGKPRCPRCLQPTEK